MSFRFEDAFCSDDFRAEHSLLLAFEASLPRVEREIIPGLQREGAGRVSIIVDESDYQQSFADASAATRVNVDYSFHGTRLRVGNGRFHSKCYLLTRPGALRLLVSSANLTSTGLRTNIEVVDQLDVVVDASGRLTGAVSALRSFEKFLDSLPGAVLLSESAILDMKSAREALHRSLGLAEVGVAETEAVEFLSTLESTLLSQIRDRIPADAVTRIVAVSPFFDPESAAILALLNAFPNARMEIYKDSVAVGDLNGERVAPFGKRVKLFGVSGTNIPGEPAQLRRLHAKAFIFEGRDETWFALGSANLTAAAWLRSAANGGNVEAMTVRYAQSRRSVASFVAVGGDRLMRELDTRTLPLASQRYEELVGDVDVVFDHVPIEIRRATATPGNIEILCRDGAWANDRVTVNLSTRDRSFSTPTAVLRTPDGDVKLVANAGTAELDDFVLGSLAVVVTVDAIDIGGTSYRGRSWLLKTDFLGSSASARARRHSVALMTQQLFVEAPHLRRVADWLAETSVLLATELFAIEAQRRADSSVESAAEVDNARNARSRDSSGYGVTPGEENGELVDPFEELGDFSTAPDDWELALDGEDDIRLPGTARRGLSRLAQGLSTRLSVAARIVAVLFEAVDVHAHEAAHSEVNASGVHEGRARDETAERIEQFGRVAKRQESELLRTSALDLRKAVDRVVLASPSVETIGPKIDALEILLAFLYRLELQARIWGSDAAEVCAIQRRDALAALFSVDGWSLGACHSWMLRVWSRDELRAELLERWKDEDRVARLVALAAAGAALGSERETLSTELIVGLKLATNSASFSGSVALGARLHYHASLLAAQSGGLLTADRIVSAISDSGISDTEGAAIVRNWRPAVMPTHIDREDASAWIAHLDAIIKNPHSSRSLCRVARAVRQQVSHGRTLSEVERSAGATHACAACGVAISSARFQRLHRESDEPQACESCGALLVPCAWNDPICALISEKLVTAEGFVQAESTSGAL